MEFIKIAFTVATAVVGWLVANYYTSRRDTRNSRRSARIEALSVSYKALVRAGIDGALVVRDSDGKVVNKAIPVEDAIALVHLYGSQQQSDLASEYARQIGEAKHADSTQLVNCLRQDIRRMLGEDDLSSVPTYLRITLGDSKLEST